MASLSEGRNNLATDGNQPEVTSQGEDASDHIPADVAPKFEWSWRLTCWAVLLFVLAAAAEVGGGWLVWETIRHNKPVWWAVLGCILLILYGYIPTLQPTEDFGRIFAVYGGFFIVYSYGWGWALDGDKPDTGDFVGGGLALFGVLVCLFWPRQRPRRAGLQSNDTHS